MSTRRALSLASLALLAGLAAVVLFAALHRPGGTSVHPGSQALSVRTWLSPQDPQFGDTVVARAEVLVDPRRVDPGSVRLRADFAPYRVVSGRRTVGSSGGYVVVAVTQALHCLTAACVPRGASEAYRFPPLRVVYRDAAGARTAAAAWPVLRVGSRVAAADLARPVLRVPDIPPPGGYRLPPGITGYGLLALAALLALAGGGLVLRAGVGRYLPGVRRQEPLLERILGELAAAAANGDTARRRRALEQLARELEQVDGTLSSDSRVLAWGRDDPRAEAIAELTRRVRAAEAR